MAQIVLNGEWLVKGYLPGAVSSDQILGESGDEDGWLSAQVPGEIHLDLMRSGVIPDPFYRDNEERVQWVHERDWWYRRTFTVDPELLSEDRVELVCEGLDTFALIFLNGEPVGNVDNMFRAYRFDARPFLRGGDNELVIGFHAPHAACHELAAQHGTHSGGFNFCDIVQARKAQYSSGWDWGPFITSVGIWRPIRFESWSTARLISTYVHMVAYTPACATIEVEVEVEATRDFPATVSVGIAPLVGEITQTATAEFPLHPGEQRATVRLEIPDPQRWWPIGYGEQTRYRAEVQVAGEGLALYAETTFGLRTVELRREPDSEGESFIIVVNGEPIFCKGANWIPGDQFLPRVTTDYYRANLTLAAQAGINMMRVWGGGVFEEPAFYDLCDELGLLVWQDFLFACGSYPEYEAYRESVTEEARQGIRALRNHPALALWCGNNECHWLFPQDRGYSGYAYYDDILPKLVAEMDPSCPYWNGSPYSSETEPPNSPRSGDRHAWEVWGSTADDDKAYLLDRGRFISEFGMQGPPTRATLESFTLPEDRQPWSRVMEVHEKMPDGYVRLYSYMARHFPIPGDFWGWVYIGQAQQCLAMRRGIAHWRARKWRTSGTIFWQLNDCWPVTSWAVIDYQCRPKPAWYEVRRLYAPHFLTIEPTLPPHTGTMWGMQRFGLWPTLGQEVHLVNDTRQEAPGRVRARLMDMMGGITWERTTEVVVPPNAAMTALMIPRDELGDFDYTGHVLVAEWEDPAGAVRSRDIHLFCEPKHLQFTGRPLGVTCAEREVTITAPDLALYVAVEAGASIPSDTFFHLLPGEARTITLAGPLHELPRVWSLADLLRP